MKFENSTENDELVYFIYCRKSSDSEDKQIASLPAQEKEMRELAKKLGLKIAGIFIESRSAFHPGRPKFNEMIERIQNGEANAVLTWATNRIARNPLDGGKFVYLIQQGIIEELKTKGGTYTNTPEHLFALNIDLCVAQKASDDLSLVVRRGNVHKFHEKREWGGVAKPGYLNVTNSLTKENTIEKDPVRFTLLSKAFKLILNNHYTPMESLDVLNNDMQYKTRETKKLGNKPMSKSSFYKILSDPFYYGLMERKVDGKNVIATGTHEPILTEDEFNRLQIRLGKKGKPRNSKKEFAYKEVLKCGECGGSVTAEEKIQIICSECKTKFHKGNNTNQCKNCHTLIEEMHSPKILEYVFYHCTKRVHRDCSQGSISLSNLEKKITQRLTNFEIVSELKDWAITYLNELNDYEEKDQTTVKDNLISQLKSCDTEIRNLLRTRIRPRDIESNPAIDQFYDEEEARLFKEKKTINKTLKELDQRQEEWFILSKETFNFAYTAQYQFETGDAKTKTYVLSKLGSNLTIKDKNLLIYGDKPYFLIEKGKKEIDAIIGSLEPMKKAEVLSNLISYEPISQSWRRERDSNPR